MPPVRSIPDLNSFMEKKVTVRLQAGRRVSGILRGVDKYMNVVLYNAVDETRYPFTPQGEENEEKIVMGTTIIRGSAIVEISEEI